MNDRLKRPVAFIAIHAIEERRDADGYVPCGYGVVLPNGNELLQFWVALIVKDTQDCYADAATRVIHERALAAAERPGECEIESVDFRVPKAGFVKKFGEVAHANAKHGLTTAEKPYDSYPLWNETNALKTLSGSTFSKGSTRSDRDMLRTAKKNAISAAGIAANEMSGTKPRLVRRGEGTLR